ncbi:MAG: hypothetical protein R3C99_12415 [Pirellulaceae bacterium]
MDVSHESGRYAGGDRFDWRSRLKLVLDTYHFGLDPAVVERLPELASRIARCNRRCPPTAARRTGPLSTGRRRNSVAEIVRRLTRGGYDGFYELELLGEEIESFDYRELLADSKASSNSFTSANSRVQAALVRG